MFQRLDLGHPEWLLRGPEGNPHFTSLHQLLVGGVSLGLPPPIGAVVAQRCCHILLVHSRPSTPPREGASRQLRRTPAAWRRITRSTTPRGTPRTSRTRSTRLSAGRDCWATSTTRCSRASPVCRPPPITNHPCMLTALYTNHPDWGEGCS